MTGGSPSQDLGEGSPNVGRDIVDRKDSLDVSDPVGL
jgi:hypothetical protein